jgi:hypothetical protein
MNLQNVIREQHQLAKPDAIPVNEYKRALIVPKTNLRDKVTKQVQDEGRRVWGMLQDGVYIRQVVKSKAPSCLFSGNLGHVIFM